ncbi:MAG TPA: ATP-dependent zinc metalloprotease FtsH [Myxococcales bacterium]|nr:ATP-dependent zinc metalloprotease FtsH [Myxococcales bacterium]
MPSFGRRRLSAIGLAVLALALLVLSQLVWPHQASPKVLSYTEFFQLLDQGRVQEVAIGSDDLSGKMTPAGDESAPQEVTAKRLPGIDDPALLATLREKGVKVSGRIEKSSGVTAFLVGWIIPLVVLVAMWSFFSRAAGRSSGPLSIGRSQAKIHDLNERERVTFADVAGVDEAKAELVEIVRFLKEPERYRVLGARAPKGVLLVGPPGTGKTLLARAVSGEAGVPFFSISGSEFVQMFVGVGAARVRDLFEQAKQRAPCIVFIDELDAVGRTRSGVAGGFAAHEEREQTLNQLLVEMDGFDGSRGVVILSATNRPEILDRALLRAGRFDRQVVVDRPDLRGREAILEVHACKVKLAEGVDLGVVARRTPGMSGADLANVVNEAALAAARRAGKDVQAADFEEAVDRIQLGLRKQGLVMTEDERRRVAYHESGHALVALSVEHADPVHRVTIIPRSIGALGATLQLPTQDRYLVTREELRDRLCVMLGGRSAEELVFEDASTGAQDDLERATETARQMVCRFGMSDSLGPIAFGDGAERVEMFGAPRPYSEETGRAIDAEIRRLVEDAHGQARQILRDRRLVLEKLAKRLLAAETLERAELEAIVAPPRAGVERTG